MNITRRARWLIPAAGSCAAALALAAGCSAARTAGATAAHKLTARQAIILAAHQSQRVNSASAAISWRGATLTMSGTEQLRRKPLLIGASFRGSVAGRQIPFEVILTSKAIYLKTPALSRQLGKPWLGVSFSALPGKLRSGVQQLVQRLENSNPLTQTSMLPAAKNPRAVGTQLIDGVQTTHYQGSFSPTAALAMLPAPLRKLLSPAASLVTGNIRFDAWIDAQHQVRKLAEVETTADQTVATTLTITSINQPVHITPPPASQTATQPGR